MVQPCQSCGEPSNRRCSGCKTVTAWYCSSECQKAHWVAHIFDCNPRRAITTADYLALAVDTSHLPMDKQTCEDYGFSRTITAQEEVNLLGLYIGLIEQLHVSPKKIHSWRVDGTLVQEIKSTFDKVPEASRGKQYPWFLENQHLLDTETEPPVDRAREVCMRPALDYAGISRSCTITQSCAIISKWPQTKHNCVIFCSAVFSQYYPTPSEPAWLHFGYCVCPSEYLEVCLLAQLYRQLVNRCSFDELWIAYDSSSLIQLMDIHGLEAQRRRFPHLEDVLRGSPEVFKSVWHLKQIVIAEEDESEMIPSVMVDYGFMNCKTQEERLELKSVYRIFFLEKDGDPIALHEAAIQGRLFRHIGATVKLSKRFKRLMKNPYPL